MAVAGGSGDGADPGGRHRGASTGRLPLIPIAFGVVFLTLLTLVMALVPRTAGPTTAVLPACTTTTPVTVLSSTDKAGVLTDLAARFSSTGRDSAGRCVRVRIVSRDSGVARAMLARDWNTVDGPRPDVWAPSDSIWLRLLSAQLATAKRPALLPAEDAPSVAKSPIVVAMPRPMARALGWPTARLGWSDLLSLAKSRQGWAQYGYPAWGDFSLGKTNPNLSQAGLMGTIATYYAAVGRTTALSPADVSSARTRSFVAGVEQTVVRYGDTVTGFSADWQRADAKGQALTYLSALVTEENLVAAYNEGDPTDDPAAAKHPPHVPLVALYPKEGTFVSDHPYATLTAPWVTSAHRAGAKAFLDYLLTPAVQRRFQAAHFRSAAGVSADTDGSNAGIVPTQPSLVLAPPSVDVTDQVLRSWSQLRKTANVMNLLDVSGSMSESVAGSGGTKLSAASEAAASAMNLFTDDDAVGLWSFSSARGGGRDHTELVPVGPMRSRVDGVVRRTAIARALGNLRAGGGTSLYDSVAAAYRSVRSGYRDDRINAVVVLTDGRNDKAGGLSLPALLKLVGDRSKPVRIITIAYGPDADTSVLARIAQASGGASYVAPTPAEIPTVYSAALSNF